MPEHPLFIRIRLLVVFSVTALAYAMPLIAQSATPHLGYGFNVAEWDIPRLQALGFNWIKVFEAPDTPLPVSVLVRVAVTAQTREIDLLTDLTAKLDHKANIQAWEIGNEVNIRGNADYGWNGPPDVAVYKALLCTAYTTIKSQAPNAIVVSAGLAPVGRLTTADQIDEREFVAQLLDTGGGACLDVIGFHPYGFSADYDAAPDVAAVDPAQNCAQGFCFRGAEKIYEVMQAHGAGDKKIWATEFGWITQPPDNCLADVSWKDRQWQIVSAEQQGANLAGAFQYADAHWPWMGAMFIFNLNFYTASWYSNECEQMLWYSVREGSPAESDLISLVKNIPSPAGRLKTTTTAITWLVDVDEQPLTLNASVDLANWGWQALVYTATVDSSANLVPMIDHPTGSLSATAETYLNLSMPAFTRTLGTYTGTLTLNWYAVDAGNHPRPVALQVDVVSEVYHTYLPAVSK